MELFGIIVLAVLVALSLSHWYSGMRDIERDWHRKTGL